VRERSEGFWAGAAMHFGFYLLIATFVILMAQVGYAMYQLAAVFS
jgi:hypothetical protein